MSETKLVSDIVAWTKKTGYEESMKRLVAEGVGLSTTQKILNGRYTASPRGKIRDALERILRQSRSSRVA